MKAKVKRGNGFVGVLEYVFGPGERNQPDRAEIVSGNLSGANPRILAAEFAVSRRQRREVKNPVWHCSLYLPKGERLDSVTWHSVCERHLQLMGINTDKHMWVAVRHKDTEHDHVHLIVSRIGLDATLWHGRNDVKIAIASTQTLEREFGLHRSPGLDSEPEYPKRTRGEAERKKRAGQPSIHLARSDEATMANLNSSNLYSSLAEPLEKGVADYFAATDKRKTKAALKRLLSSVGDVLGTTLDRVLLLTPVKRTRYGSDVLVYLLHFDYDADVIEVLRSMKGVRDVYWDGDYYQCWCVVRRNAADTATDIIESLKNRFSFFVYTDLGTIIVGGLDEEDTADEETYPVFAEEVEVSVGALAEALKRLGHGALLECDMWAMTEEEFVKCKSTMIRTRHSVLLCRVSSRPRPQYFTYDVVNQCVAELPSEFQDKANSRLMSIAKKSWAKRGR